MEEIRDLVSGFANTDSRLSLGFGGGGSVGAGESSSEVEKMNEEEFMKFVDRSINATIVLAAGSFAITKLLTIDSDYWHVSRLSFITLMLWFCEDCVVVEVLFALHLVWLNCCFVL